MKLLRTLTLTGVLALLMQASLFAQTTQQNDVINQAADKYVASWIEEAVSGATPAQASILESEESKARLKKIAIILINEKLMQASIEAGSFSEAKTYLKEVLSGNETVESVLINVIDEAAKDYNKINAMFIDSKKNGLMAIRNMLFTTYPNTMVNFTDSIAGIGVAKTVLNSLIKAMYEKTLLVYDKEELDAEIYTMLKKLTLVQETIPGHKQEIYKTFQELDFSGVVTNAKGVTTVNAPAAQIKGQ
jgi:hypothetical protein